MLDVNTARSLPVGTCLKLTVNPFGNEANPYVIEGVVVCVIKSDEGVTKDLAIYYVGEHGDAEDPTLKKFEPLPYTRLVVLDVKSGRHYLVHCTEEWFYTVKMTMQLLSFQEATSGMQVFTCNDFAGHYPTGTAAVIIAPDEKDAEGLFSMALDAAGLTRANAESKHTLVKLDMTKADAIILNDGDY